MTLSTPPFFNQTNLDISAFDTLCKQETDPAGYPHATTIQKNIPIYDGQQATVACNNPDQRATLRAEWTNCLNNGPGVFVIRQAYADISLIDKATAVFNQIIAQEQASGTAKGDHFGNNVRIWNSLQKLGEHAPDLFVDYYGNPLLALACEAWLGPHYQITAQVNIVKPGGKAQSAHRDYHLGFQSPTTVAKFPAHAQIMSQYLTLQGGIIHSDMPVETGPTLFLPYSHQFRPGYLAYTTPAFATYFDQHKVQLPLAKGDMVYFSPALFHGAGNNTTNGDRFANLVQISSAFGRPMETVNRYKLIQALYPVLLSRLQAGTLSGRLRHDTIAATADSYAFPTNLDSDPPIGGNAPHTSAHYLNQALDNGWAFNQLHQTLTAYTTRQQA